MSPTAKIILSFLFGFAIIVSHYSLTYIFIILLMFSLIITKILNINFIELSRNNKIRNIFQNIKEKSPICKRNQSSNLIMRPIYLLIITIFTVTYFLYINFLTLRAVVNVVDKIGGNILDDFGSKNNNQVFEILLTSKTGYLVTILHKSFNILVVTLICIGIIGYFSKRFNYSFDKSYISFILGAFVLCLFGVFVPNVASIINTSRLFHISLLFLSPFCILGVLLAINFFNRWVKIRQNLFFLPLALFLILYLCLNAGLFNYIAGEPNSNSFSLGGNKLMPIFNEQDTYSINLLLTNKNDNSQVLSDLFYAYIVESYSGLFKPLKGEDNIIYNNVSKGTLIFLGTENIVNGTMWIDDPNKPRLNRAIVKIQDSSLQKNIQN
ncbi:MAG: hypothetical protein CVV29_12775, partial [Methanobacteriales archaeon HGW-Methanobacteriales-2]